MSPPRTRLVPAPPELPPAPPDEELLGACAGGDGGALGALFDRHALAVYRFLSRYTGASSPDLDPLVNETFLQVYKSAQRFRGDAAVKTWILAVASNIARHHTRSETRRLAALTALESLAGPGSEETQRALERRDLVRRLAALVRGLPHDLRVAYVMCDLEEMSSTEVARALGVPPGTLWRRLHEARRALRARLEREIHP